LFLTGVVKIYYDRDYQNGRVAFQYEKEISKLFLIVKFEKWFERIRR